MYRPAPMFFTDERSQFFRTLTGPHREQLAESAFALLALAHGRRRSTAKRTH